TLEQLIIFIPAVYAFATLVSPLWAAIAGAVFIAGRAVYYNLYIGDPDKRGPGVIVSVLANAVLVIGTLIAAVMTLSSLAARGALPCGAASRASMRSSRSVAPVESSDRTRACGFRRPERIVSTCRTLSRCRGGRGSSALGNRFAADTCRACASCA